MFTAILLIAVGSILAPFRYGRAGDTLSPAVYVFPFKFQQEDPFLVFTKKLPPLADVSCRRTYSVNYRPLTILPV